MPESTISKSQSISSTLNRNIEIFDLTPSTLLTLWEIDTSVLMDDAGLKDYNYDYIFRFHNSAKIVNTAIYWRNKKYYALPIQAQGFEYTTKGSPAAPKLTLAVNEDPANQDEKIVALSLLKARLKQLNDLSGVKVTRRRVFAKYIDGANFETRSVEDLAGKGFTPDQNMQFDPDIYYIDRKSLENKSIIEFELGSIIDVEGVQLPGRIITAKRCPAQYRGCMCLYEYVDNRQSFIHGDAYNASTNPFGSTLLDQAPPVANEKDESIQTILGATVSITVKGEYKKNISYLKGHAVWVQKDGIKYYFVASQDAPPSGPPNPLFWISDSCSKTINGCRLRFGTAAALPFAGFPSALTTT